jgi:putative FmdB family regulatory protein
MPFYEYQCKSCGHELEAMQKVSDSPLKKCPHCGKSQLQRLMSAPVFRLKGGGWYETDFKGDKDNQRNLADKPEADAPKDAKDAGAKTKDDKGKDEKGKDNGKGAEPKASEAVTTKESPGAKDKAAEKPAAKSPAEKSTASRHTKRTVAKGSGKKAAVKAKSKRR